VTAATLPPLNLLVVDDEPDLETLIRQKFRKKIREGAYDVTFARNGQEALDALGRRPDFDIILTDINMPVMDGLTLLARLAERDGAFKSVVISAYGDMGNIRTAMNRGAFDFITKPIDFYDLEITIERTAAEILRLKEGREATRALIAMGRELEVAARIQTSILPKDFPPFPERHEFEIFAAMTPARQVGGDFYDFFFLDEDRLAFVIGDVSGKGIPAALFMAVCRTLIKATAMREPDPDACLDTVNRLLCAENSSMFFVTVFYGVLNTRTGEVHYGNAGHNPPYWLRRNGMPPTALKNQGGLVLGVLDTATYRRDSLSLAPGECLFLYTDGITEAMNPELAQFQDTRLVERLIESAEQPLNDMMGCVVKGVEAFTDGHPQHDDITMLAIRFTGADT